MSLPQMTAAQLIEELEKVPPDATVKVWLPGTRIALHNVSKPGETGIVLIEGNVESGGFR